MISQTRKHESYSKIAVRYKAAGATAATLVDVKFGSCASLELHLASASASSSESFNVE